MRVLNTGGAGFIGSSIAEYYAPRADIRVLDSLQTDYRDNNKRCNVEFIEDSVIDKEVVQKSVWNVDYVFHQAALISVPESMAKSIECVEINTQGTLIVLQAAAEAGVKKLYLSRSAAIPFFIRIVFYEHSCNRFYTIGKF